MKKTLLRKRRRITSSSIPEITLTPLIDTALTLLIIFMVTTPMIQNAIKIRLPEGQVQEGGKESPELVVSIDNKGSIFFNNQSVTLDALGQTIKNHLNKYGNQEKSVWVRADGTNSCDILMGVIDRIKVVGGIKDVKVATQRMATKII